MNARWVGLAAILAVTVAATLISAPQANAEARLAAAPAGCTAEGHYEVCFSDPGANGTDTVIEKRLVQVAATAGDGDIIRATMYKWSRTAVAEALAGAADRGADVRVVLDDYNKEADTAAYRLFKREGVTMTHCVAACLGNKINHNKFFLFRIDGTYSTVLTSTNLTTNQMGKYNDSIRVIGDHKLWRFYADYWNRLQRGSWTHDGDTWRNDDRHATGDLATKGYVYPRTDGDNIVAILDNVTDCRDDDKKIWVAMSLFTRPRDAVARRLEELHEMGCNVKVVTQYKDHQEWVQTGPLPNSKVRYTNLHHKFIVIDAKYNGEWRKVVFTGSHNLTSHALTDNDEAVLRVQNTWVTETYEDHFEKIYGRAHGG
ncbi:phosphatidylserine/phosphatidylglycerophosphate/cardiolipin synthase-like enzyme [Stackebrandtia albiflava]|uniref:phospholipase D n=1 Tax=Stackebrandtia albiflava TaxID=406432 RepID=A0A562V1A5_9ACTN|nr:phospholipase D-like domain-containing protein [Stackebrandtia albiflava]TWJ11631.1 phosphatidylserine/phosphatidylglycerophosphate/cardiolipin synthase-like enzyme [Stackebrandtia albiflava]